MATPFHLEIVSPERTVWSGEAEEVSMRTDTGEIAFLAHHEDFVGAADVTVVRITTAAVEGSEHAGEVRVAVHGGFVHVEHDPSSVRILAGIAELASEIDVERARRALEAAESAAGTERAAQGSSSATPADGADHARAHASGALLAMLEPDAPEVAARRARVRLDAAGVSVAS
jgi:F-type H+-transporting ATPase subunit epsilon